MTLTITGLAQSPSVVDTVWQFFATDEDGNEFIVAADHRPAQAIWNAFEAGLDPMIESPPWWAVTPVKETS